jgi:hypothetical protein
LGNDVEEETTKGTKSNPFLPFVPREAQAVARSIETCGSSLVLVRDRKLFRWIQRDDLRALRREHNHLFDARGGNTIRRRTERFYREYHAGLQLIGFDERI